jgi:hypothetical protein
MENITKIDVKKMKADIKVKVEEQKFYINQRRTKRLIGKRKIKPSEAQWKHLLNGITLRIMYAAYAIARNKDLSLIDSNPIKYNDLAIILLKKYEIQVEVEAVV